MAEVRRVTNMDTFSPLSGTEKVRNNKNWVYDQNAILIGRPRSRSNAVGEDRAKRTGPWKDLSCLYSILDQTPKMEKARGWQREVIYVHVEYDDGDTFRHEAGNFSLEKYGFGSGCVWFFSAKCIEV